MKVKSVVSAQAIIMLSSLPDEPRTQKTVANFATAGQVMMAKNSHKISALQRGRRQQQQHRQPTKFGSL